MAVDQLFLKFAVDKLDRLMRSIEACTQKLTEDQIWSRGHENENAVGNLLLHLRGNVHQWIISGLGSQQDIRDRDAEFDAESGAKSGELVAGLRQTIDEARSIISALTPDQLLHTYDIQIYKVTGVHAVFQVVEHFSQHTGQIIFATKLLTKEDLGFQAHLRNKPRNASAH